MKDSKNYLLILGLSILTFLLSGCTTDININNYIDKNDPFGLTFNKKDSATGFTKSDHFEISVNSDKYKKIIQWGNENTKGWKWTPASYITDISIGQDNFRLLHTFGSNGVVIGFTDKEGKPRQYTKAIKKGELDFLTQ